MGAPEVEAEASDGEGTGWADAITGLSEAQPAASFCAGGAGEVAARAWRMGISHIADRPREVGSVKRR